MNLAAKGTEMKFRSERERELELDYRRDTYQLSGRKESDNKESVSYIQHRLNTEKGRVLRPPGGERTGR